MSRWLAFAGIGICWALSPREARAQTVAGRDQVMAARAAAIYLLRQSATAGRPVFLVPVSMSYTPEGGTRVEMKWDSAQWHAVADSMRADVATGDLPLAASPRIAHPAQDVGCSATGGDTHQDVVTREFDLV